MAIEEESEEGTGGGKPEKGKSKVLLIVIVVLLLTLISVGGFLAYSSLTKAAHTEVAPEGEKKGGEAEKEQYDPLKLGQIVALEPFIVNLSGDDGKRFVKVTMQVEINSSKVAEEIANKMPQIKDMIITVLSAKTVDEILTVDGKFKLKEQILTRINSRINTGVVKNVYFVEFIIQ